MAAKRPDFNQINKLISRLEALESDFIRIFGEEQAQLETLQEICRQVTRAQAVDALALIPVGELKNSRRLAATISRARKTQLIHTTNQLLSVVEPLFHREREKKDMAKVFQALRIEVNHEMGALADMLAAATQLLGPCGRLSVITYHSLEDRMVKNVIRAGNVSGKLEKDFYGNIQSPLKAVNNKPIVPDEAERQRNPRSRSAKLRIAEKA